MDNMENKRPGELGQPGKKMQLPNADTIKGLIAVVVGVVLLVATSYKLLLSVVFFCCGVVLTYRGLQWLKLKQVTDFIDTVVGNLKKVFYN